MQQGFEFITPEDKTKYLVKFEGHKGEAWYMDGKFIFNNYYQTDKAQLLKE